MNLRQFDRHFPSVQRLVLDHQSPRVQLHDLSVAMQREENVTRTFIRAKESLVYISLEKQTAGAQEKNEKRKKKKKDDLLKHLVYTHVNDSLSNYYADALLAVYKSRFSKVFFKVVNYDREVHEVSNLLLIPVLSSCICMSVSFTTSSAVTLDDTARASNSPSP